MGAMSARICAVVAALLLSLTLAGCSQVDPSATTIVRRLEEPLPAIEGDDLDGKLISTEDYRGDVLVVNVWGSWCGPCEAEQPALVRVADAYAAEGVSFMGINHTDQLAQAKEFVRRFDVPYRSLYDAAGRTAADLGYVGLPDTYIVDRDGTMRIAINGPTDEAQLSALLDEVLGNAPSPTPA
jgi:thiol-disulfide isomerase/thioredoxin